jgi:crotonobetainyl-CoA:carnitine CoA-transferase CaiB-like acyl-CoA transferase
VLGLPFQFGRNPVDIKAEAPQFGQHTEEILLKIAGHTWDDISQLRDEELI